MATVDKPLAVGKTDRYQLGDVNLLKWMDGEALTSFTVEPDTAYAALVGSPAEDEPGVIGFLLTGVAAGRCNIHVNYATATRSDCATMTVIVKNC
ncbi:hypothetical protein ORI99_00280 [Alishewanella sp. SMS9]|nr:hypothetical protein [Alishewanella sp. SMS9]